MRYFVLILAALSFVPPASGRGITFDDLYGIPRCQDPRISPDGRRVAFELRTNDLGTGSRESHLWMMESDGSRRRQLTFGPTDEWHPRWSVDGSGLWFLSDRGGDDQIWFLPLAGGEAGQVTTVPTSVSTFEVAPTGGTVVFVSRVFPDCPSDSCQEARLEEEEANAKRPLLYDRLLFRHYSRWNDGRINRLFRQSATEGTHQELFPGAVDVPTALLGYRDFALSPDGKEICFGMNTTPNPAVLVNNDLYLANLSGGEAVRLTEAPGLENTPRYSPDGRFIAYRLAERAGYESDQRDLLLFDTDRNRHLNMTADFDRSVGQYVWGPRSKCVYFTAIDQGLNKVWRLEVERRRLEVLLDDAVYDELRISTDGRYLILTRSLSHEPAELFRYDLGSGNLRPLTDFTAETVRELDLTPAEEFWFRGALEDSVHGFLTRPPDFDAHRFYPLVVLIHGGPQWCWLGDFNYYGWNTQLMAAQGYLVAQIDPHGSVGYGVEFKDYISGNWGRGDFEDIMKGVDHLIGTHACIDTTRMAALGRSYGGFLVNWICGHTDRFRCLISVDGTYNHLSDYGSTDELWFPEWEFGGTPWENREEYVRSSPMTYAGNFRTPTMVIHGQNDYRVDLSEGLQMFTALQRLGVSSQLLYFRDEGHSVSGLRNLRYVYEKQLEWLARWLAP